jgi:hypothetical protein
MSETKLTKLQTEYIDRSLTPGAYVAYPSDIFQSSDYLKWRRKRLKKMSKLQKNDSLELKL